MQGEAIFLNGMKIAPPSLRSGHGSGCKKRKKPSLQALNCHYEPNFGEAIFNFQGNVPLLLGAIHSFV